MRWHRTIASLLVLLAGAFLVSCDSSNDIDDGGFNEQEVESAAVLAAFAGPSTESAEQMMLDMVAHIGAPAAMSDAGPDGPISLPSNTSGFDLGNGISGSMELTVSGVYTFTFSGTVLVEGSPVTVQGTLVLTPAATQPESGSSYLIDYDATAAGARGSATWSTVGTLDRDAAGDVTDYDLTMSHTVTPTGQTPSVVTALLSPSRFDLIVTGPYGNTLRFGFDRVSMSGVVSWNGRHVATVEVSEGCAHVDWVDESRQDVDVCPAA